MINVRVFPGYLWKDNSNDGVRSLLYDDEIPLDKILLETDAPFMYPFLGRGRFPQSTMDCVSPGSLQLLGCCSYQRNEPCAMPVINELVAGCMKRSPSELADITTENALRFFNLKGLWTVLGHTILGTTYSVLCSGIIGSHTGSGLILDSGRVSWRTRALDSIINIATI